MAEEAMTGLDTLFWKMERDPRLRGTATTVMLLDRPPEWDRFLDKMERVSRLTPRFRQRVVETPLRLASPRWATVADFDLAYHVRRAAAPAPGDLRSVLDLAQTWNMVALDRERPLWEYTLLEGLEGGKAALIQKVHHSISDGVGGMEQALIFFDDERDPADPGRLPSVPEPQDIGSVELAGHVFRENTARLARATVRAPGMVGGWALDVARDPVGSVRRGITTARSTAKMMEPTLSVASPVMRERSSARRFDCFEVPLDDLKRAAKVAEGTVNDVFLAAMSGGLARYHEQHGEPVAELRVTVPVSIRAAGDATGGNRITAMRFALPTAVADPDERVAAIHDQMVTLRHDPAIPVTDAVADVIGRLPAAAVSSLFATMLCHIDFLASNVPGFPEAPYVAGARADRWFAFGPTEGSALNVTLLSHGDVCCVGVTSDVAAVADPELLTSCLQAEFEALIERAV